MIVSPAPCNIKTAVCIAPNGHAARRIISVFVQRDFSQQRFAHFLAIMHNQIQRCSFLRDSSGPGLMPLAAPHIAAGIRGPREHLRAERNLPDAITPGPAHLIHAPEIAIPCVGHWQYFSGEEPANPGPCHRERQATTNRCCPKTASICR